MGTRSSSSSARRETSSAKSRSVKELWPNATPIEHDSTIRSRLKVAGWCCPW